jgi:amino-acid N-acetyltransferase
MHLSITFGTPPDAAAIRGLLADCGLPTEGIDENVRNFLVAWSGEELVGTVGLELLESHALLRSLAVAEKYRGQGLGKELYERILSHAHSKAIETIYVLTLTAGDFFARLGFRKTERSDVPSSIADTREFSTLCPATAEVFARKICDDVRYYSKDNLILVPDIAGAKMWSVALRKTMLTWFEVQPHCRFERHSHDAEQITMVLEGELFFELDERLVRVGAGEVIAIPSLVSHAVYSKASLVRAIDAWSPVPERYRTAVETNNP